MDEWDVLSNDMELEGSDVFLHERIRPAVLREAHETRRAVCAKQGGRIIGFAALWQTDMTGWVELGSLWVHPARREHGLGKQLYRRRLELIPEDSRAIVVTHTEAAVKLALGHGFTEATKDDWFDRVPFAIVCGPCDRPVLDKSSCPFRAIHNQCRLLVR